MNQAWRFTRIYRIYNFAVLLSHTFFFKPRAYIIQTEIQLSADEQQFTEAWQAHLMLNLVLILKFITAAA